MGNWLSTSKFGSDRRSKKGMSDEEADEKYEFPLTLDEFGYYFNDDGQLRNKETNEAFDFAAKPDNHKYNQKRYEALGDIITNHIYHLMEKRHGLNRWYLPSEANRNEPRSFVYTTEDVLSNDDKMLILIHGSGAVRAGQWARRLIINDCLDSGTQLPFISRAINKGYSVIVANTNINKEDVEGEEIEIKGNSSPEEHVETLWTEIVQKSKAKNIAIVAHSYGGVCTLELAINHIDEFWKKVFSIALTDSVHSFSHQKSSEDVITFYKQRARNWASAYDSLDTPLETKLDFCPTVSAGTDRHDYTSYSSMESIFKFFDEKYSSLISTGDDKVSKEKASNDIQPSASKSETNALDSPETKKDEAVSQDASGSSDVVMDSQEPLSQDVQSSDIHMDSQSQQPMSQDPELTQEQESNKKVKEDL